MTDGTILGSLGLCGALLLFGCGSEPTLYVDLRTDFVVGVEVARARTFVSRDGRVLGMGDADLSGRNVVSGARIAEIAGLVRGELVVVVDLLDPDGGIAYTRRLRVTLTDDLAVTVVASRVCNAIRCPNAGDPATFTECLGGLCVEEGCTALGGACGDERCSVDADCDTPAATCAEAVCSEGICFVATRRSACASDEACVPETGCVAVVRRDAGVFADGGSMDGGAVTCSSGCDDGNPCTDDSCVSGACTNVPTTSSAGCDDGNACTHSDHCEAGGCRGTGYTCGDPGSCQTASCDGGGGCSVSGGCGPGSVCDGSGCVACGGADQRCCASSGCNSGLWCFTGVCTCGQPGGPCCPWDGSCASGNTCAGGTCCINFGESCGGAGACCDGVPCRSGICFN